MNIRIEREDANAWWAHCPFHRDRGASLIINKTGRFAGRWHCFSCGRDGWAEELGINYVFLPTIEDPALAIKDWEDLYYKTSHLAFAAKMLADSWGVSSTDAQDFGHRWDGESDVFPMYSGQGKIIGLQRRYASGRKVCYPGSKLGLFLPNPPARPAIDCVAMVPDNDGAGQGSVCRLVAAATGRVNVVVRNVPDRFKDLREFYRQAGEKAVRSCLNVGRNPAPAGATFNTHYSAVGYVCEGLSDAVVAHHLGFYAMGLPCATSGHDKCVEWCLGGKSNGTG